MSREEGQFGTDKQPNKRRGKAFKTKLFEAIREKALLEASPDASNDDVEQLFIQHLAVQAMSEDNIGMLRELMNKSYPPLKPTMDAFSFDLPEDSSPSQKAQAILVAVSNGDLPPDVGSMLITASKAALDIDVMTDLKERIEALEKLYESSKEA